ncbi:NAD-dependent DNA ligase LigA [bacterium]|nr:NAD-dependent DNA ligase LigA [bacterium]
MDKNKTIKRIEKLKTEINYHRYLYHVEDREEISESALDSLKKELADLESNFPELITPDSPTQRVGGKPLNKFEKIEHSVRMISMFDAFARDDVHNWIGRLKRLKSDFDSEYYCELKLDGLAMALRYKELVFNLAATRGDGMVGENVTQNVKTIESVPLRLRVPNKSELKEIGLNIKEINEVQNKIKKSEIEIRGEVVMTIKELERLNKKFEQLGKSVLANPRNAVAGSIRQLNSEVVSERKLAFYAYELIVDLPLLTQGRKIKLLELLGFKTLPQNSLFNSLDEIFKFRDYWASHKNKLPFQVDGIVIKINQLRFWPILGIVGKGPRYMMAYKFPAEQSTTKLIDVKWQIGRTGILTPIATLEPVRVGGVIVTHATLHNMDEIERLGLRIGDTVIIERAGDVIPKIIKVLVKLRDGSEKKINISKKCPNCGGGVKRAEGEVAYRCINTDCYAVNLRRLMHFVSKGALDIEGLGPKIVEQLIKNEKVSDVSDFFSLSECDLKPLERFADKSAKNLIKSIQDKKQIDLAKFIYALGIRHVGEGVSYSFAIMIALKFQADKNNNIELLKDVKRLIKIIQSFSKENLMDLIDLGPVISESLYNWFQNKKNIEVLMKLKDNGVQIKYHRFLDKKQRTLQGKKFVLTGTLENLTRIDAKNKIRELGGEISTTVSKNIDYVIVGKNSGSKNEKAKNLGIKIINEDKFINLIK